MKPLLVLIVGLMVVGCETIPVKELTLEEKKVVGEYEFKTTNGKTHKQVYLEKGVWEWYISNKKHRERKWAIVDGEIHIIYSTGFIRVYRINPDKSITDIATIEDGKRTDVPKDGQRTFKKIK